MSKTPIEHIINYRYLFLWGAFMTFYEVNGSRKISGSIEVQGAKNSALPILAATLLIHDKCVIHNCPELSDVEAALRILITLGCVCVRDANTVIVDASDAANFEIPEDLMREMRSSVLFLGAIVSRMGKAKITSPGGCELGPRPIDLHLSALNQLGVIVNENDGFIECSAPDGLHSANVKLAFPSVGATENIIIAAAVSKGTTVIEGAACEPEISDLADFLNNCGARIYGAGSSRVVIEGVRTLYSCEHSVIPDRIVAATYLTAAAITKGEVELNKVRSDYLLSVIRFFEQIGCSIKGNASSLYLKADNKLNSCNIITGVYPAFPTDAGPLTIPLLCTVNGISNITETIFQNRFRFVDELNKFGANVFIKDKTAVIKGINQLKFARVFCTDLRGGAALTLAALAADGVSQIGDIYHIERGYCNLPNDLTRLGADIKEVEISEKEKGKQT